jgi:hypothetical protein
MTDEERALRIEISIAHHVAYGIEMDQQRAQVFLNDTAGVPIEIFRQACKWSRQSHEGNFPPTVGQVVRAAVEIEWERNPTRFRNVNGGAMSHPRWYRRMKAGKPAMFAVQIA